MDLGKLALAGAVVVSLAASWGTAQASPVLKGEITADNFFFAYLSESPDTQGTLLATGDNWQVTYPISAPLAAGTYFLNVVAQNWTGEAGLVGSFSVGAQTFGTDTSWKTAFVPDAWSLDTPLGAPNQPSWSAPQGAAFSEGTTNVAFWGAFFPSDYASIDGSAQWIWGNDSVSFPDKTESFYNGVGYYQGVCGPCTVEFQKSFTVSSVPEPATWAMMVIGISSLGAAMRRRRNGAFVAA